MLTQEEQEDYKAFIEDCKIIEERFKNLPEEVQSEIAKELLKAINEEFLPILKQSKAHIMIELGMI